MGIQNAVNLKSEIENMKNNWDERSQFKIKGVSNLSPADLDTIDLYCDSFIQNGGMSFSGLMDPMGEVKEVLDKYNVKSMFASAF